jgi:CSLREA domain-containing protein
MVLLEHTRSPHRRGRKEYRYMMTEAKIETKGTRGTAAEWISRALAAGLLMAALVAGSLQAPPAQAADTFTVERTVDTPDANVGDGDCDVSLAATGFQCTLRAAIQEANATPEADLIRFSILDGGTGVQTIQVGAAGFGALPAITAPVTIDGYTQPGASPNTKAVGNDAVLKIELNGASAGGTTSHHVRSTMRARHQPLRHRHHISGDSVGNRIEGNFIGTDPPAPRPGQH